MAAAPASGGSQSIDHRPLKYRQKVVPTMSLRQPDVSQAPVTSSWEPLVALGPAWVALAWLISKASWFWRRDPDLQFGWIVVVLCGFVLWEAWESRPPAKYRWSAGSVMGLLAGLGLLFLTQIFQNAYGLTPGSMSGLAAGSMLVVMANLGLVFGYPGLRNFGFGVLFLLIAMPIPSVIHSPVVLGLQSMVAYVNVQVLLLAGIPAQQAGSVIRLPNCTVGVDEACSGIRSLQSTIMATLFIGHLILQRSGLRWFLLGAGIGLAIFGNLCRSLFLSLVAHSDGPKAIEKYHDTAGWSILVFAAMGVALLSWWLSKLEKLMIHKKQAK